MLVGSFDEVAGRDDGAIAPSGERVALWTAARAWAAACRGSGLLRPQAPEHGPDQAGLRASRRRARPARLRRRHPSPRKRAVRKGRGGGWPGSASDL